jgi:Centromere DNA-binding protein complex CBF3 subunit, domain 2/Transcriptional activator of glycolytic enzymes
MCIILRRVTSPDKHTDIREQTRRYKGTIERHRVRTTGTYILVFCLAQIFWVCQLDYFITQTTTSEIKMARSRYRQQATQSPSVTDQARANLAPASPTNGFVYNPNDIALNSNLEQAIVTIRNASRPENTRKTQEPKIKEFESYCDQCFPGDPFKHNLGPEKVYRFMYYQAFREKKKCGGRSKRAIEEEERFDKAQFDEIMKTYGASAGPLIAYPTPINPIAKSTFESYKAVIKLIHTEQEARRVCGLHWSQIWLNPCNHLHKLVKERAPMIKKLTYQEKVDGEFAPYTIVERYEEIEEELWNDSALAVGKRSICTQLRHLCCVKYLTAGILRSESLHRAELSDFLGLNIPKLDSDVHRPWLMVQQIPIGKTNHGQKLYGRATRHSKVELCAVGGCSFYLQYRFYISEEFANFTVDDWLDNSKWFDVKFLAEICIYNGTLQTKEIKNDSYSKHIKKVLQKLNIACNKLLHLGRNLGSRILEMLQEESEEIRRMGQWNPSMQDNCYSSKLPMGPIRKLAGYHSNSRCYFNTRTEVMPDENLLRMCPIGKWSYDALQKVIEKDDGSHQTAVHALKFFCHLNIVFLQDAAAMMCLRPERANHPMFEGMPFLFRSDAFKAFKEKMQRALDTEECPMDAKLEHVIPGLHQWHSSNFTAVKALDEKVDQLSNKLCDAINTRFDRMEDNQVAQRQQTERTLAGSFLNIAQDLLHKTGTLDKPVGDAPDDDLCGVSIDLDRPDGVPVTQDIYMSDTTPPSLTTEETGTAINMADYQLISMHPKHASLSDVWDEWHGEGKFTDSLGGLEAREKLFGAKWRKKNKAIDSIQFSRTKRIVTALRKYSETNGVNVLETIAELEEAFVNCKGSVGLFVDVLQQRGMLKKLAPRGKRSKD